MTSRVLTTRPPFPAINDVAVLIPAHAALHVGCIAGCNVRLWKIKHNLTIKQQFLPIYLQIAAVLGIKRLFF